MGSGGVGGGLRGGRSFQAEPISTPTGGVAWLFAGDGWYTVSVWLTLSRGGMAEDLMWRILVSVTSQSICIITS